MTDKKLQHDIFSHKALCPSCHDGYVHFTGINMMPGDDDYKAWAGRGDAIRIPMYCEAGPHYWDIVFGFHKGNTFIFCQMNDPQDPTTRPFVFGDN